MSEAYPQSEGDVGISNSIGESGATESSLITVSAAKEVESSQRFSPKSDKYAKSVVAESSQAQSDHAELGELVETVESAMPETITESELEELGVLAETAETAETAESDESANSGKNDESAKPIRRTGPWICKRNHACMSADDVCAKCGLDRDGLLVGEDGNKFDPIERARLAMEEAAAAAQEPPLGKAQLAFIACAVVLVLLAFPAYLVLSN